jgi:hypothetical protein
MMPNFNNPLEETKEKIKSNFFISFVGLVLILSAICFTGFGSFQLFVALFTGYEATVMDLLYFTSGAMLLFFIGITNILMDIKSQNKTIAKGILHLLKQKLDATTTPKKRGSFEDTLKSLFNRQPGMTDEDVSGSISVYDMSNPNNPIFQGDFKNMDEMNDMRKRLIDKMLNSQKEFKGKKMTKQEMLDTLSLRELKAELKLAVDAEDWLWAASLRDKIAEKEDDKKKGNSGSEKKDNPEM